MDRTRRRGDRIGRRLLAVLVLLAGTLGVPLAGASTAQAATPVGNDISWPQCSVAQGGYGNPMPASSTRFVVVGTTRGLPFTVNPCLTEQARWIRDAFRPFHAYAMAAYPTTAQLDRYGASGRFSTATLLGRLRNVGYAEAAHSINTLRAVGLRPPRIWIDIEARSKQPWPAAAGNATAAARNRAVIEGMLAAYKAVGIPAGFYSNASGWSEITNGWQRPDIPFWATVGSRGQGAATAQCGRPGLNGGPVHLVQWWDTQPMDWDVACPGHAPAAPRLTLSWPTRSSARSTYGRTDVVLTAGPSRRQTYQLTVRDACTGSLVWRSPAGVTADKIVARWKGLRSNGSLAPTGVYKLVLQTGSHTPPTGPVYAPLHQVSDAAGRGGTCRKSATRGFG